MKRRITLGLALMLSLSLSNLQAAPAAGVPAGSWRAQRVEIIDPQGFERPMVAATMMVPAGWRAQGRVSWQVGQRCGRPYQPQLRAEAPDGLGLIELHAGGGWGGNNFNGSNGDCPRAGWSSAQDYLRAWVQRQRPGATWLEFRPRPERSREIASQSFPGGGGMRQWMDTGQAMVSYTLEGRPVVETLAVTLSLVQSQMPMHSGGAMLSLNGESMGVLSWRAPQGQLDLRQFDAMWQTLQPAPEWQARVNAGMQQMAQDNAATQARISQIQAQTSRETLAHIARRGEIRAQTQADIADMRNEGWRAQSNSQDRQQRQRVDTLREVQRFRDPDGPGTVALPQQYPHAWKLRDGSYLMTDSASFDPGRDLGLAGQRLQPAPP